MNSTPVSPVKVEFHPNALQALLNLLEREESESGLSVAQRNAMKALKASV